MFRDKEDIGVVSVLSLIELLLVLLIVSFLVYKLGNIYFKKPALDQTAQKALAEQGIKVSSPAMLIEAAKINVRKTNQLSENLETQLPKEQE
ncbi:MAG: hypothetical protein ABII74_02770 [Elusimicrobiota bacterium]